MHEKEQLLPRDQSNHAKVDLFIKRWWIALVLVMQKILVRYFMNSIGIVNNIYVLYFNISYVAVDWFTTIQYPGSVLANFVVAWLIYADKIGVRRLSIAIGVGCIFTSSCMLLSSFCPKLYAVIYLGQFIMGLSYSTLLIISIQMANSWFPVEEIGKAMLVFPVGGALASILTFLIPSKIFSNIVVTHHNAKEIKTFRTLERNNTESSDFLLDNAKSIFSMYNGCLLGISLLAIVPVVLIVQDKPPKAPSAAQDLMRRDSCSTSEEQSLTKFLKECCHTLSNGVMLILFLLGSIRFTVVSTENMFLSEILRPINIHSYTQIDANVLSGSIMSTYEATAFLGHLISSYVFDRFKRHQLQLKIAFFLMFLSMFGLSCGTYLKSVTIIWLFNALVGFFGAFPLTPLFDTAVQHFYPIKSGMISSLLSLTIFSGLVIIVELQRLVLMFAGGWAALLFTSALLLAATCFAFLLKPNFKIMQLAS